MRILMLSWEYPPHVVGGLGAHVAELIPALARAGVEIHLMTPRLKGGKPSEIVVDHYPKVDQGRSHASGSRSRRRGPSVYRVPKPPLLTNDIFVDSQAANAILEKRAELLWKQVGGFDLVHVHDWLVAFAGVNLKRGHKIPLIATIHATERGRGQGHLGGETAEAINSTEWWLTYEAWRVICTSRFMAREVTDYFRVPSDKVDIVPNGIDAARFDTFGKAELKRFRARWAKVNERIVFFVGRLVHEKGAHLLIEAAPRVLARFPDTRFIIAGTGMLLEGLRKRTVELDISSRVTVAGYISDGDRDRLLSVANVAVFPSLYEPFGIVALEAMASRCPVVASSVGGLADVVTHDRTGVTIYPDNVDSLAWGILRTLEDPAKAKTLARLAHRQVLRDYDWDRIAKRTADIYARVLKERKKTDW